MNEHKRCVVHQDICKLFCTCFDLFQKWSFHAPLTTYIQLSWRLNTFLRQQLNTFHRQQPNMFHQQLQNISPRQQPNISHQQQPNIFHQQLQNISHRQQPSMFHKQQQSSNQKPILQLGLYRGRRRQQCLVRKHDRLQRLFLLKKPSSLPQHQNLPQKHPRYLAGVAETHLAEDLHLVSTLL